MDTLETKSPAQTDLNELQAQFDTLRHLVVSILILVVVMSGTLNIYLLRQVRDTTRELTGLRQQFAQMNAGYQNEVPWMQEILKRFTEYGQTHPTFAPIRTKYNLIPGGPTGAAPTVTTPRAPAAPPKK